MKNNYSRLVNYFSCIFDCNLENISSDNIAIYDSNKINVANQWLTPVSIYLIKYNNKSVIISSKQYFNLIKQNSNIADIFNIKFINDIRKLSKLKNSNLNKIFYIENISNNYINEKSDLIKELNISDLNYINEFLDNSDNYKINKNQYLKEIEKNVNNKIYYGIIYDNKLVSLILFNDNPYKEYKILELGIETLRNYRNKGFAKILTKYVTYQLFKNGYLPVCRTEIDNIFSQSILKKLEFKEFCEYITF
jgi:GNAT acetyltransferase